MNSRRIVMSEAFTAGLGMALGLATYQFIMQTTRPPETVVAKRILVCQKCAAQNPIENKFCGDCGQSLYPHSPITCQKCNSKMLASMKYCGNCGSVLKK